MSTPLLERILIGLAAANLLILLSDVLYNVAQISILPNVAPIAENRACRRDTRLERLKCTRVLLN